MTATLVCAPWCAPSSVIEKINRHIVPARYIYCCQRKPGRTGNVLQLHGSIPGLPLKLLYREMQLHWDDVPPCTMEYPGPPQGHRGRFYQTRHLFVGDAVIA
jgi:hypothetical protein